LPRPPFSVGRRWRVRASKATPQIKHRVFYDPTDGYEYEKCPMHGKGTWHRIDWHQRQYQDIDRTTGAPIPGSEGEWRPLK
jgi:hypothetical protein